MSAQDYTITSVEDTEWEPDKYGNVFYSIQFEGWKGKVLWKTPNRPENNTQVYGSINPSQSGKAMIFKKEKKEDWREGDGPATATIAVPREGVVPVHVSALPPNRNDDIRWGLCTKEANLYVTKNRPDLSSGDWAKEVNEYANALYFVAEKPQLDKDTDTVKDFFGGEDYQI